LTATFATIQTRVTNLVGSNVAITSTEIQQMIQAEHETILNDYSWADRKAQGTLTTVGTYSTGTVSGSAGSATITGSGTTFTSAMVGRWIRIGSDVQYYKVATFASTSQITIETALPADVAAGTTFVIFQHIYSLPSNCERITSMTYNGPIIESSHQDIDRQDPYRSATASVPMVYAYMELDTNGNRSVELWPVPSAAFVVRIQYLKTNTLTVDADKPLYRSDVLVWKSGASAAFLLFAKTGDIAWSQLATTYLNLYKDSLQGAVMDDLGKNSPAKRIRDVLYSHPHGVRDDFWINHDPGVTY
jgi:hypothetical protein